MTKDDIIRMACKAGFSDVWLAAGAGPSNCELPAVIVEGFAHLAVAAEREACAVVCEELELPHWPEKVCQPLAAAIRARSQS